MSNSTFVLLDPKGPTINDRTFLGNRGPWFCLSTLPDPTYSSKFWIRSFIVWCTKRSLRADVPYVVVYKYACAWGVACCVHVAHAYSTRDAFYILNSQYPSSTPIYRVPSTALELYFLFILGSFQQDKCLLFWTWLVPVHKIHPLLCLLHRVS